MDYDYSDAKRQICVLIGAGMSAGAGIPTFRGEGGEWMTERKVRKAFEIDNFKNSAELRSVLWRWLADSPAWNAKPTRAHWLLKQLDDAGHLRAVLTQNFDTLEKKAGIRQGKIRQLHGRMDRSVCLSCGRYFNTREVIDEMADQDSSAPLRGRGAVPAARRVGEPLPAERSTILSQAERATEGLGLSDEMTALIASKTQSPPTKEGQMAQPSGRLFDPHCPDCGGIIKPDIVLFGEPLDEMMLRYIGGMDIPACDELWCIGSSLAVYPAADIPRRARELGKRVVIISTDKTEQDNVADEIIRQPADTAVAVLVNRTIKC